MAALLFIILATFIVAAYLFGKRDLLSPWFLLCLMIFATYCVVLLNYKNWDVKINGTFIVYLSTAIIAFGLGAILVGNPKKSQFASAAKCDLPLVEEKKNVKYPINLVMIISIVAGAIYVFKLISDVGFTSLGETLRKIYDNVVKDDYSPGFIFNQMLEIVMGLAYINTYRFFIRVYSRNDKTSIVKLLVPIFMLMIMIVISTDRNIFLRYAFYLICLWVLFYREYHKGKNVNFKIARLAAIMLVIVMVVFFVFGKLKQYQSGFVRMISIYAGSGMYDFNLWIKDFDQPLLYGKSTFLTFINTLGVFLRPLGINLQGVMRRIDPEISYASPNGYYYSSNIYTAMKPFVEDFGYFGVILYPFIMGVLFQWLFKCMKKSSCGYGWIVYCQLLYPIFFFPILEQFFRRLHLGFIYELFWVFVPYQLIFGRKSKRKHAKEPVTDAKKETGPDNGVNRARKGVKA